MRNRSWRTVAVFLALTAALSWTCAEQALSVSYNECKIPPQISVPSFQTSCCHGLLRKYANPAYVDFGATSWVYGIPVRYSAMEVPIPLMPLTRLSRIMPLAHHTIRTHITMAISRATRPNKQGRLLLQIRRYKGFFYISGNAPDGGVQGDIGTFDTGISGNFMNWLLMSRTDSALKALIGGKLPEWTLAATTATVTTRRMGTATCPHREPGGRGTDQGPQRRNQDTRGCGFLCTADKLEDGNYDNWNSSSTTYRYPFLELTLDSTAMYRGVVTNADARESGACKRYYEMWNSY